MNKAVVYYTSAKGIAYRLFSPIPVWSQADRVPFADGAQMAVNYIERPQVLLDEAGEVVAQLASPRRTPENRVSPEWLSRRV